MKKYFIVYKNAISTFLQFRLNLALLLLSHIVILSGFLFLWIAIYASGQTAGSYTLHGILTYYILLAILQSVIAEGAGMAFEMSEEIKRGILTNYLLKPFSFILHELHKLLGKTTINAVFILPIVIALVWIFSGYTAMPSAGGWFAFAGMSAIGFLFYFLLYFPAGLTALWIQEGRGSVYALLIASNFLNGTIIPLDLFPSWAQRVLDALPFRYLIFLPIQTWLGRVEHWPSTLSVGALWLALLILLNILVWRRGVRRFEAVGI